MGMNKYKGDNMCTEKEWEHNDANKGEQDILNLKPSNKFGNEYIHTYRWPLRGLQGPNLCFQRDGVISKVHTIISQVM